MVDRTAIEAKIEAETKAKEAAYAALRHKPVIEVIKKRNNSLGFCIIN
jgi:hypothetical protein